MVLAPPPAKPRQRKFTSREEEAELSLKHTEFSAGIPIFLCLFFLLLIFAEPLVQIIAESGQIAAAKRQRVTPPHPIPQPLMVFELLPTWKQVTGAHGFWGYWSLLPSVKRISEYENALKTDSVVSQWVLPRMQLALTGLLGAGNEKAYCGKKGWLYYRPDVDYLTGAGFLDPAHLRKRARSGSEAVQPDPVKALVDFHKQLAARDITLIVMPAASKPVVHPELLSSRYRGFTAPLQNRSYAAFLAAMEREGILVFDDGPVLTKVKTQGTTYPYQFLQTDTHWTPTAMERTASTLAEMIRSSGLLPPAAVAGYTRTPVTINGMGDLVTMLKLPASQRLYKTQQVQVQQVHDAEGKLWRPRRDADVLLLGDSYMNIFSMQAMGWGERAGFAEQLSYLLQRPLDAIVMNAGGSYATRLQLQRELLRGKDRLAGKRLVIYEFAIRDLYEGDWKMLKLPAPKIVKPPINPVKATTLKLASIMPPIINPGKAEQTTIAFSATGAADYTVILQDGAGKALRTLGQGKAAPGSAVKLTWDGCGTDGKPVADGAYSVVIAGKDADGKALAAVTGSITVSAKAEAIRILSVTPATFNPAAGEAVKITFELPAAATYTLTVKDATGKVVATPVTAKTAAKPGKVNERWNGKDRSGKAAADGKYTLLVEGTGKPGVSLTAATGTVTVKAAAKPVDQYPGATLVIQGKVKSRTEAPAPNSVPYKDCVVALEVSVLKTLKGTPGTDHILVFIWGLRDNKTRNAGITTGSTVTLSLTPWDQVEGTYGGFNRVEPEDMDVLMLDSYWGEIR